VAEALAGLIDGYVDVGRRDSGAGFVGDRADDGDRTDLAASGKSGQNQSNENERNGTIHRTPPPGFRKSVSLHYICCGRQRGASSLGGELACPHTRQANLCLAWNVYNQQQEYTSMRTNIVIDDKLMRDTLRATGLKTKREAVEEALRTLLRLKRQAQIRRLRGKLDWQGDLNAMRTDS